MKKILISCFLIAITAFSSHAGEFKFHAEMAHHWEAGHGGDYYGKGLMDSSDFIALTRIRFGMTFEKEKDLYSYLLFQVGPYEWQNDFDQNENSRADLRIRLAYLNWRVPNTKLNITSGFHELKLPGFMGGGTYFGEPGSVASPGKMFGITANYEINENINLVSFWGSSNNLQGFVFLTKPQKTDPQKSGHGNVFASYAKFDYETFRIHPWAMYVHVDKDVYGFGLVPLGEGDAYEGYYAGVSMEYKAFDPLFFQFDGLYNKSVLKNTENTAWDAYYLAGTIGYKTNNGLLKLIGWYSSGDKEVTGFAKNSTPLGLKPKGKLGRPVFFGSQMFQTSLVFGDTFLDNTLAGQRSYNIDGTYGVLLELTRASFFHKSVEHTLRVAHVGGTNEIANPLFPSNIKYLGTKDKLYEIDFNSYWWLSKTRVIGLELGAVKSDYDRAADYDKYTYRVGTTLYFMF